MRNRFKIIFILYCLAPFAHGNDAKSISLEDMKMFASVAGGYAMEKHCRFGTEERFSDFTLSIKAIYKNLLQRGAPKENLNKLWKDSEKISMVEPYSKCEAEAKSAVAQSFERSWKWTLEIVNSKS